jgi:hypothetical protein
MRNWEFLGANFFRLTSWIRVNQDAFFVYAYGKTVFGDEFA